MLWVATENWGWLLLAAGLGAGLSSALTLRRTPPPEQEPPGPDR